jgi:hypothetical protein
MSKAQSENVSVTASEGIAANDCSRYSIQPTTSSAGVWWLNVWVYTNAYLR